MNQLTSQKSQVRGSGYLINRIQTLFVSLLRLWTIPIVVLLSISSGFTTYYGLSHFITPWIALIITIAIQSIIVICSVEIAGMHWRANPMRFFSISASLGIALIASITFSYFKFYEISEKESLHIDRVQEIRQNIKTYLDQVLTAKNKIQQQQKLQLDQAYAQTSQAYLGALPQMDSGHKNQIGEGPYWRHFHQIYLEKKQMSDQKGQLFTDIDQHIRQIQANINDLDSNNPTEAESAYEQLLKHYQDIQLLITQASESVEDAQLPQPPMIMTYRQFTEDVKPAFSMYKQFSWFAFICAAMVDFFTVLLSYKLEFSAPGPLTDKEEELVYECLKRFTEFRINKNDELEIIIEKTELEKARRYSDWGRMFMVGLLLSRGFLRKVDHRTVEFAPNLYPLVAEKMAAKIAELKAKALTEASSHD